MSDDAISEDFKTHLATISASPEELQETRKPTVSLRRDIRGEITRQRLHTLPELRLSDDAADVSPDLELVETLGTGGMGVVRLARQVSLDREVAVKTIRSDQQPNVAQALLEEAYVTGYLEHPNIIPIYTVGRTQDGAPLIVMKRVEGTSWREQLEGNDQWPPDDLASQIEILSQVSNALHFAHSRDILHRDIKPENVMIGDFGEVYVLDWGIAVSLTKEKPLIPHVGDEKDLSGTPGYLAPEMAMQDMDELDERTDVYLLGATLHDILTGEPRHSGTTLMEYLYTAHQSRPYEYDDSVPAELAAIANQACHRDKDQRFQSAEEFRNALQAYLRHRESVTLSNSADEKLEQLTDLLEATELDEAAIHDTYGECRFGFDQALRMWPDNPAATDGLQQCLEMMADYHLKQQSLDACRVCLADLPRPAPSLERRAEELACRLDDEQQDLERLKEMEKDLDLSTSRSARSLLVLILGIIWTGTSLYGALRYGGEDIVDHEHLRSHMISAFRNFGIAAGGIFLFRKRIFANAANARLAYLFLTFSASLGFLRWSTWYLQENILMSRMGENVLAILLLIAMGLVSDLRICAFALFYVALGIATLMWPEYYPYTRPAAIALTFGGFAWVWSPSQIDKKMTL